MSAPAIETDLLTKRYVAPRNLRQILRLGRKGQQPNVAVTAVDGVSLTVNAGELYGLLGPNGAGKTTLIKLLCTMVVPSSGEGRIFGVDLRNTGDILQMIGMASGDERSFYWRLTGRQNLEFYAALYGMGKDGARQRTSQLLEQIGLAEQADRPFRTYSSGQKQRLSIARALLHRPRLLFLDEPTRSLDPTATLALHTFIQEELLKQEGMTIFLTTHRLDEAQRLCHRIGIMDKGRLRTQGTTDELRARLGSTVSYRLWVRGLAGEPSALGAGLPGQISARRAPESGGDGAGQWLIEMETSDREVALAALVGRIVASGGQVVDVRYEPPSLEQVFQRFTHDQ